MTKTSSFITVFTALLFSAALTGQSFNTAKTDSLLNLLEEKNKAMGSMALMANGNTIYAKAIGYAAIAPEKRISDTKTKYRIGSISKMFTATLVFQLIDDGRLDLSTKLDKFYPSVVNSDKITIGNLLSHRSGIHNFTSDSLYMTYFLEPKTRQEMVQIISNCKPDFEPDAKTEYSNSNFLLLGYIIEDLYKQPYKDILLEKICSKINLTDTYYGGKTDVRKNESYSFRFLTTWEQQPETDMSVPHGAGAIVSTPSDLVSFINGLFSGALVSESSLNHMLTITNGLGMGMMQFPYEDKKVFGHGGSIDGFNSMLCYLPDDKLAISYISNGTAYSVNDILLKTINIYFQKPEVLPVFTTFEVQPEDLEQYVGVYSSPQIPIKITVSRKEGALLGQGSGQPAFQLEPSAKDVFKFESAGIVMTFYPAENQFILEQGGGKFTFTREE